MIGAVLKHRYEVLEKIGEGNLFTVYKCDDKIEGRLVAAKVLLPQYAANRMFAERILVEAQAMVGVSHPGMAEVYDCGEENGSYFVIVEHIRGVDLRERIRRNAPLSLSTVVDVGMAICDVLDFAHRRGFVHGDLRPGNILVTAEGHIKLTDFWASAAVAASQPIRTNAMMRTVHYMSPEVTEGEVATPAADLYSLGIILFELLTGHVPFDGDTPIAIALKHAREPMPSLRALNPGVPKNLESAIAKALQKAPEGRFRSAKAMLNELKSIRDALHLAKPLVWSQAAEKSAPKVLLEQPETASDLEDEPRLLSVLRRTLIVVVGIIAILAAMVMGYVWMNPKEVRVPSLLGKTFDAAQMSAEENKIRLNVASEQFNEEYPAGTIYYMNPPAGRTIKSGKSVDIWISKGSRYAYVPRVIKLPLEQARERILDAGLNVGEVSEEYSGTIPAGNIVQQSPTAGVRQERGQLVNLVFSLGPELPEAPLDTNTYNGSNPEQPRSFDVKFRVPVGHQDQTVQITVEDDNGENIVHSEVAHPGDTIEQTVQGVGDRVTIRIYIDDKLVREEPKWR